MAAPYTPFLLAALCLTAALPAQRSARFTSVEHGFRLMVPKVLEPVPVEPNERQTIAKWVLKGDSTKTINEVTLTVLVARIGKAAPTTGGEKDPEKEREKATEKSLRDAVIEQLNGGTTVPEYLKRRGYKNDVLPVTGGKPVKNKNGEEWAIQGIGSGQGGKDAGHVVKVYGLESVSETFVLIGLGDVSGVNAEMLEAMAKTLERGTFKGDEPDDVYDGSDLPGIEFRTEVRKKLVKGWEAYDTQNFIFITTSRNKKVIDEMLADLEIMRKVYVERFPPIDTISAVSAVRYCEKYDDYLAYGGPPGTGGYWNHVDEELVLVDVRTIGSDILKANPNLKNIKPEEVLYHEAMHQYFFYANGHLAPGSWFNEGYGEFFGGAQLDRRKGEPRKIDRNKFRMDWVMRAKRANAWPDLPTFLKMSQGEFYGPSSLQNYAFAWAFCFFLESHRQDPKGNKAWGELPDQYLKNLRQITEEFRKERNIDPKDKKWLTFFESDIQKKAYEVTFKDVDVVELEKAWVDAMKKWR